MQYNGVESLFWNKTDFEVIWAVLVDELNTWLPGFNEANGRKYKINKMGLLLTPEQVELLDYL